MSLLGESMTATSSWIALTSRERLLLSQPTVDRNTLLLFLNLTWLMPEQVPAVPQACHAGVSAWEQRHP